MALVVGLLRDVGGYDDLVLRIHRRLPVVALLKALARSVNHDPRFGIGEIALFLRPRLRRLGIGHLRHAATCLLSSFCFLGNTLRQLAANLDRLGLGTLAGSLFQRRLGFADFLKTLLPALQFSGQFIATASLAVLGIILVVGLLGSCKQRCDLLLKTLLRLPHPLVAHCLVLRRVGFDFGAIQRDVSQLDQTQLSGHLKHLHKETGKRLQMALAKRRDAVVIGMLVRAEHAEGHLIVCRTFDLARRRFAHAVRVEQKLHHHARVIRGHATSVTTLIHFEDGRQIERVHHVTDE